MMGENQNFFLPCHATNSPRIESNEGIHNLSGNVEGFNGGKKLARMHRISPRGKTSGSSIIPYHFSNTFATSSEKGHSAGRFCNGEQGNLDSNYYYPLLRFIFSVQYKETRITNGSGQPSVSVCYARLHCPARPTFPRSSSSRLLSLAGLTRLVIISAK